MGRPGAILKEAARRSSKAAFAAADAFYGAFVGPRILIYHQIGAGLGRQMEVTREAFVAQLDWMEANGTIVDLERAVAERGSPNADRTYVLTFDDGYEDFYRLGYPELVKRDLPFTLYITTHPVESREPLFPGGRAEPLTWAQIEDMATSGLMTIGAHTHTHADMRTTSSAQIAEELGVSDALIEQRTGVKPAHFAYPWGYWSEAAGPLVGERYATATLGTGAPITAITDPLLLNRVAVQLSDGVVFFRRKMLTGMRLEDRVRRRLTGYAGP